MKRLAQDSELQNNRQFCADLELAKSQQDVKQKYSRSKLKPRRVVVDPLICEFLQDPEDKPAKLGRVKS